MQNSTSFGTTSNFVGKYLHIGCTFSKLENEVIDSNFFHTNTSNFGVERSWVKVTVWSNMP